MPKSTKNKLFYLPHNIVILYEDKDIIIVDKPPALLTMGSAKEKHRTVYSILSDYIKRHGSRNKIYIIHRLDRETSGILVFGKSEKVKHKMQDSWDDTEKKYIALVHGHPEKKEDTLTSYLIESGINKVYSTFDAEKGKLSKTHYRVIKNSGKFSLLDIKLITGRKHQIRVQLADAGYPVAGDVKYGKPGDKSKRLALHASSITFNHPVTGKPCLFETEIPGFAARLL